MFFIDADHGWLMSVDSVTCNGCPAHVRRRVHDGCPLSQAHDVAELSPSNVDLHDAFLSGVALRGRESRGFRAPSYFEKTDAPIVRADLARMNGA